MRRILQLKSEHTNLYTTTLWQAKISLSFCFATVIYIQIQSARQLVSPSYNWMKEKWHNRQIFYLP